MARRRAVRHPQGRTPRHGPALLPQAGVAIGMALIAVEYLPDHGAFIMALTIGATVVFEMLGPLGTRLAVKKTMDARD